MNYTHSTVEDVVSDDEGGNDVSTTTIPVPHNIIEAMRASLHENHVHSWGDDESLHSAPLIASEEDGFHPDRVFSSPPPAYGAPRAKSFQSVVTSSGGPPPCPRVTGVSPFGSQRTGSQHSTGGPTGSSKSGNGPFGGTRKGSGHSNTFSSPPPRPGPKALSPREDEFVAIMTRSFIQGPMSIAIVILKAAVEASPHAALMKEVMAPYQNSLHAFFERRSDEFIVWNYTEKEIAALNLDPYFKAAETRVAPRKLGGRALAFDADSGAAIAMRAEEDAILQALAVLLADTDKENRATKKDTLEALRQKFPNVCGLGGLLTSMSAYTRFLQRHSDVVTIEIGSVFRVC